MTDFDLDTHLSLPRLSSLRLSPDGRQLVVAVQRPAPDGKKFRSAIWRLDPAGASAPVRLTRSAAGETVGAFSRDGSLLFTSTRPDPDVTRDEKDDEITALWLLPAGGGEAQLVCAPSGGVTAVHVARDADTIVFSASVFSGAADLVADLERQKARKKAGVEALLLEGYPIRHWDTWLGPREVHLFSAVLAAGADAVSSLVDLTPDAGTALVETDFDVTPDGKVALTSWRDQSDLTDPRERLLALDCATGEKRFLTELDRFWYVQPACSPDGRYVAAVRGHSGDPERIGDQTLYLVDLATGQGRDLTPNLDLWPQYPTWAPDASAVYFTADRVGRTALLRVGLSDGRVDVVEPEGSWSDVQPAPDGQSVYGMNTRYDLPPRPVRLTLGDGAKVTLRSFEDLDSVELPGRVERVTATASDGQTVESWLVVPNDADAAHPAPLVVWAHGGPLGSWNGWHWRWNPHVLAARGYAVLMPDPALSTGYGLDFIQRGWARWGQEPYTDIMAAFEEAAKRPDVDGDHAALMGGSFGGYMANWVAGSTDRFKAIVTHASLWELRGFHGTTDYGSWWEREFGNPYEDESVYQRESPHRLVANIKTPMLVIHGAKDFRVPISEGLRLWTDLARHGVEAKFLYFPDENHWILKPQNARVWYETVLAFLDQYVLGKPWQRPDLV